LIFRKAQFTPPLGHRDPFSVAQDYFASCDIIFLAVFMSSNSMD
jgi:hypothetical protein